MNAKQYACLLAVTAAGAAVPVVGQSSWAPLAVVASPIASAYDVARGATVLLSNDGEFRHWEWDGVQCLERPDALPPNRSISWLGSDQANARLLAVAVNPLEVLEWDGARWGTSLVLNPPEFNVTTRFVFDENRGRIVAFHVAQNTVQTFEWDGTQWYDLTPASSPPARYSAAFAFDRSSNRCILYGGTAGTSSLADCWGWNGTTWTQLSSQAAPGPRTGAAMTYVTSIGSVMLYGGDSGSATWRLSGSIWSQVMTATTPPALLGAQLVAAPGGTLLVGGRGATTGEAWLFDGSDWQPTGATFYSPPFSGALWQAVADRKSDQTVLYTGINDGGAVALFDTQWRGTTPSAVPPPRNRAALSWSSIEQQVLLFGGIDGANTPLADTWNWDGADWILRTPATSPSPRRLALVAEDPNGGVMLYGGLDATNTELVDHWHWGGSNWTQQSPVNQPGHMSGAFATLDPARAIVVAVSPLRTTGVETWEWDGSNWVLRDTSSPVTLLGHLRLVYDVQRMAVVTAGLRFYEWTGTAWTGGTSAATVAGTYGAVADYTRQRSLLIAAPVRVLTDDPAELEVSGAGCALGPAPVLSPISRPHPGNVEFAVEVATRLPSAGALVAFGFGQQPLSLGSGCTSYIGNSVATVFGVASAGAQLRIPTPIPFDPSLRGVEFIAQAAVVDPVRSPIGGITITAGLVVKIGD